jgi:hypothetical protein
MGCRNREPFEIASYAGSELGEFRADSERPPRTAKLVAVVSWSWGPAHGRRDRYLICTNRNRTAWTLWARGNDFDERRMYAQIASATPFRGYSVRFAAEQLLIAGWRSELEMWDTDLRGGFVEAEGVLTKSDLERIEQEAFRAAKAYRRPNPRQQI